MKKRFLYGILAIIIIILVYNILTWETNCSRNEECFSNLANNCQNAYMTKYIGDLEMEFRTRGCFLEKKVIGILGNDGSEGASMICEFEKGKFDPTNLNLLTLDLDKCEGNLKTIISSL